MRYLSDLVRRFDSCKSRCRVAELINSILNSDMKDHNSFLRFLKRPFRPVSPQMKKKVLILEGGGMRGVFLTGVLQSFTDKHYFPWKLIIGTSAGALNGALYAADQIYLARNAFFTGLASSEFITLSNVIRPDKHILNIDWVIDTITKTDDPLDVKALRKSCPVLITATNCPENRPPETIYLDSRTDDIVTALKATSAVPYLYRGFVKYRDYQFLDGALLDPIPYHKALSMGFKEEEILVVVSRQKGYRKKQESFWVKNLYESYYRDEKHRFLLEALDNRYIKYNKILDGLYQEHPGIDVIHPPEAFKLNRISRDKEKILEGFKYGIAAGKEWLGYKSA